VRALPRPRPRPSSTVTARLETRAAGLYGLSAAKLAGLGFDLDKRFALSCQGQDLPVWLLARAPAEEAEARQEADEESYGEAALAPAAGAAEWELCFYAPAHQTLYTRANVLWLRQTREPRVEPPEFEPMAPGPGPTTCVAIARYDADEVYRGNLPGSDGSEDHFFTRLAAFGGRGGSVTLACPDALAHKPGKLRAMLRSYSPTRPSSHVELAINGTVVGEYQWDQARRFLAEATVPAGALQAGENTVRLRSFGDTGALLEATFTDWVELEYCRPLAAIDGRLTGAVEESGAARATGLGDGPLVAADVTDPWRARRVAVEALARGQALVPMVAGRRYVVSSADGLRRPARLEAVADPRAAEALECEMLIVSTDALAPAAEEFAEFHKAEGMTVAALSLSAALDRGGWGLYGPEAIARLTRESGARYLLLLGDMTFDYAGRYGDDALYAIPAGFIATQGCHAVSDYVYALAGGARPRVAVGRIPARSADEARAVLEKVRARASRRNQGLVLVADEAASFSATCEALAAAAAGRQGEVTRVYLAELGRAKGREALLANWNAGARMVCFAGHGAMTQWSNSRIFRNADVAGLAPQPALPVVVQLDCFNSAAHLPQAYQCLSEALVLAPGQGACAAVGSTGRTAPESQAALGAALLRALRPEGATMGQALLAAQQELAANHGDADVLKSFLLFGDPAGR